MERKLKVGVRVSQHAYAERRKFDNLFSAAQHPTVVDLENSWPPVPGRLEHRCFAGLLLYLRFYLDEVSCVHCSKLLIAGLFSADHESRLIAR